MQTIVEEIITELIRVQRLPFSDINKGEAFPIPGQIATGDGGGLIVSAQIDRLIDRAARTLKENDQSLAARISDSEWIAWTRKAFGPPLASIDLDGPLATNAKAVVTSVQRILTQQVAAIGPREYAFGCTLFRNPDIPAFNLGPVKFEPRIAWLDRKATDGDITSVTARRVKRYWQGGKLTKLKKALDRYREEDIIAAVGNCPYVCSVQTNGLASEVGLDKAITASRLALTAIALLWETPSKALEGLNLIFDRNIRTRKALTFIPGKTVLAGSRLIGRPHGPTVKRGDWEKELVSRKPYFDTCGEVFAYILSPNGQVPRPALMSTLGQALLWFHEACRENVALMAIVNFSASMDSLGGGKKAKGILDVLDARLGISGNTPMRNSTSTVKSTIDRIYSEGRSRTIHGTNDKMGYDWSLTRGTAEYFARLCLVSCMDWAIKNPTVDDPVLLKK